ncbi:MAG: hypothetical protein R3Y56_04265 [Akkermansia sp.]
MKTSHLLLLAAASIAPLQAQTPAPTNPVAVTLPTSPATQRAGINASLASIAAGHDFISLYNIPANIQRLMSKGLLQLNPDEIGMLVFRSVAVATDMATLSQQCMRMQEYNSQAQTEDILEAWAQNANPTYAAALAQLAEEADDETASIKAIQDFIASSDMSPIYVSAEILPDMLMAVPMIFAQLPAMVQGLGEGVTCEVAGTKAQLSIPAAILMQDADEQLPPAVLEEIKKKTIHIDVELKGNLLNIALGTNPATFKWADGLEQSVLATKASEFMDGQLNDKSFFCASLSAQSVYNINHNSAMPAARALSKAFRALALAVPADAAKLNAAADSVGKLAQGLLEVSNQSQQDLSLLLSLDQALQADIKFPMLGEYTTSKMSALNTINDKSIALMQSSGLALDLSSLPKLQALLPDAMAVSDALKLTLTPAAAADVMPLVNTLQALLDSKAASTDPIVNMLTSTLQAFEPSSMKLLSSMGSSYGLSYAMGATPDAEESVVAFAELSNKQQFTQGAAEFYQTANTLANSFGFPLPPCQPVVSEQGNVTSYSFACEDMEIQADLSDSCLSISNDPAANDQMQAAITEAQGPAIKGAVFYLDFKNAAPYIKQVCNEEDFATYEAATKPFTSALIQIQNDKPTGTEGSIRISLPLK